MPIIDNLKADSKMGLIVQHTRGSSPTIAELTQAVYGENTDQKQGNLLMLLDLLRRHYKYNVRYDKVTGKVNFSTESVVIASRKVNKKQNITIQSQVNTDTSNIIAQRISALRRTSQLFAEPQKVGVFISEIDNLIIKLLTK